MEYRRIKLNIEGLKHDYTIDTLGIVRNETNGKVLKGTSLSKNNRYVKIRLAKTHSLHRLVAEHFIDNPNNYKVVNHKDGNRSNNSVSNLEWCTQRDNMLHAYSTGLKTNKGKVNPNSILTEEQVRKIWALRFTDLTARQIRDRLKLPVGIDCVKLIRQGKSWTHITDLIK